MPNPLVVAAATAATFALVTFTAPPLAPAAATATAALATAAQQKTPVKTADDLPRHTYTLTMKPSELAEADAEFDALLAQFAVDAHGDLEQFDIRDRATLAGYQQLLMAVAVLSDNRADALKRVETARELEEHGPSKLLAGVTLESYYAAKDAAGGAAEGDAFVEAYQRELGERLAELPRDEVATLLATRSMQMKMISRDLVLESLRLSVDPMAEKLNDEVPLNIAAAVVNTRMALDVMVPLAPATAEAYDAYLQAGQAPESETDIWQHRDATLAADADAEPVVVAVWDTGIDTNLYADHWWTNNSETPGNGEDDDGNGFVDDVHGIAFDVDHQNTTGDLYDLAQLTGDVDGLMPLIAGAMDMQAGIDSERAQALREKVMTLRGQDLLDFQTDLAILSNYTHGTHVAGIAARGNPFARLMYLRESFRVEPIPTTPPTSTSASTYRPA